MTRPKGTFHPFFNVVVTVAMPLIMSVYLGIAKKAFELVRSHVAKQKTPRSYALNKLGEIYNAYINAQVNHESMLMLANNLDFDPKDGIGVEILTRKTNVANAAIEVVSKSLDLMGGKSFYKNSTLEKLFRDVQGARYHPLPELEQQYTCGQYFAKSQG